MVASSARRAVIVGGGHNGLTAAALLAGQGWGVDVYERSASLGGAASSSDVFGRGTIVDHGAAAHPFGVASPAFRSLRLEQHGLKWAHSEYAMAHPLDHRPAAVLSRGLDATADELGKDAAAWRRLHGHVVRNIDDHLENFLGPILRWPAHPVKMVRFGVPALAPATILGNTLFRTEEARALLAGSAVHAITPPSQPLTAAFGVLFGALGMSRGWPVAVSGTQSITDALVSAAHARGVTIHTDAEVTDLRELPRADATVLNLTPSQVLGLDGVSLPSATRRRFRSWRYGTGTFKVDYLLSEPVPWADSRVGQATTVHVGGSADDIDLAEKQAKKGVLPEKPFVMVSQQQVADPGRSSRGHVLWTYAHVPHGYVEKHPGEVASLIEAQIERFAPGFREVIVEKQQTSPADLEAWNPNLIGGDIAGGSMAGLGALLRIPHRIGPGLYLASGSTAPGAGVHGMPGLWAARTALKSAGNR